MGKTFWILYKRNKIDKEYDDYPRKEKGFWKKLGISFFLILLLFIISSCSQKRDPKNNYLFTRKEKQKNQSTKEEHVSNDHQQNIKDTHKTTKDK